MRHVVFAALAISAGAVGVGKAAPAGVLVAQPRRTHTVTAGFHGRSQNHRSADPDRNAGKARPVSGTVRRERNDRFALRRRTSRNAVGIAGKSSTECANAIMLAHTVNQSASVPGDLQVPSHGPLG